MVHNYLLIQETQNIYSSVELLHILSFCKKSHKQTSYAQPDEYPKMLMSLSDIIFSLSKLAMANLIRGNELELAISVGTVLGESAAQATYYALELLARKCMAVITW